MRNKAIKDPDLLLEVCRELQDAGFPAMGDLYQAAKALKRCYHTIWRAQRSGKLRVIRPGGEGGRILVRRKDLAAYAVGAVVA